MRRVMATAKAEETRDRILDAALRLFRERGFEQTTMREVAIEAGVATGAAYYYYRSKEDLVMAFYLRTDDDAKEAFANVIASSKELKKRVRGLLDVKFEQFTEHRSLLAALLKAGVDPRARLSPFGKETKEVRDDNIEWFARALDESDVNVPKDIAADLPRLLWMYHMGLMYFWIIDESPGQRRTRRLIDATLDLVIQLLKVSTLPLMGPLRKRVLKVLRAIDEE
ncbi:MAG TPA: TetR family transcriptional regulator [Thermoanaerobaculia bacterium]|nr:TetR family transcriptional regulator [Thermoanaerobaculia bacterium]